MIHIQHTIKNEKENSSLIVPGQSFDFKGHKVTISQKMYDAFLENNPYPINKRRAEIYAAIILDNPDNITISDDELSQKIEEICLDEMSNYEYLSQDEINSLISGEYLKKE